MSTKVALSSPLTSHIAVLNNKPASLLCPKIQTQICSTKGRAYHFKVQANSGGEGGELKPKGKKKFITREEEPEQYWQSAGEREGENPMKTPIPYIIIFGMSTPFVILAIAFANGWIKVPVR